MSEPQAAPQPTPPPAFMQNMLIGILKSPLHGLLSKNLLLIRFSGRKSGTRYELPVAYVRDGNDILLASKAKWWKNFTGGATVELRLQGRNVTAQASVSEDRTQLTEGLRRVLHGAKQVARFMNVELDANGEPNMKHIEIAVDGGWKVIRLKV